MLLSAAKRTVTQYWEFNSTRQIRYRIDSEYEEHFRNVFREAVRRRLRAEGPILAELSGGMDSSSIVCMADTITANGEAETTRIETISYYDDSEPNWNERPYFTKIEEKRGRAGHHIDLGSRYESRLEFDSLPFAATPATGGVSPVGRQIAAALASEGSRVLLSGLGGDEVTGGVPTPIPELCTLLNAGQLVRLARALKLWALEKRQPWFFLLFEAASQFLPSFGHMPEPLRPAPWLEDRFAARNRTALVGYPSRLRWFGPSPSFQENRSALDLLRRQAHCLELGATVAYERRFPFLDRDLLEFLFAIPRDQVVRPGQRRSLMRRALSGIVPDEILKRRRKAFVARAPMIAISEHWSSVFDPRKPVLAVSLGIVSADGLRRAIADVRSSQAVPIPRLMRTLAVENWLRMLADRNLLNPSRSFSEQNGCGRISAARSMPFLAKKNFKKKGGENYEIREAGDRSNG